MEPAEWPEKIYCERLRRPWTARRFVLFSAPATRTQTGETTSRMPGRHPPQRRYRAGAITVLPLTAPGDRRLFVARGCRERQPWRDRAAHPAGCCKPAVDVSHQTLASARNRPAGSAEPGGCASSRPGGVGLDDWPACWSGAEAWPCWCCCCCLKGRIRTGRGTNRGKRNARIRRKQHYSTATRKPAPSLPAG